jgi:hypothetical protein
MSWLLAAASVFTCGRANERDGCQHCSDAGVSLLAHELAMDWPLVDAWLMIPSLHAVAGWVQAGQDGRRRSWGYGGEMHWKTWHGYGGVAVLC